MTILALGGVLMPVLLAARYSERNALGLLTGAGSLGMLFPPCLPLILYAIVANHSAHANLTIKEMFLGGIGPGILLVDRSPPGGASAKGPKEAADRPVFRWSEAWAALWDAKWEMLIPVVAIGSLFTVPTTVEAAAVTATYALLVDHGHSSRSASGQGPAARHHRVRAAGGRRAADPGRRARLHALPGGRAAPRQDGRVGHHDACSRNGSSCSA